VAEKGGAERWFGAPSAPAASACVEFGTEPVVAPLLALCGHNGARGVVLLSAERVRLFCCAEGALEDLEDWELSITSLDWRERKAHSASDPARAHGLGSSGHDQFGERLDHNRQRFLAECGALAARRLEADGLREAIAFGAAREIESFKSGFGGSQVGLQVGEELDLISAPKGRLAELATAAIERLDTERDRAVVARALEEAKGGSRGAAGLGDTKGALAEGRVDHLVFDGGHCAEAESLIRAALASSARVTVVRDELAAPLAEAEGVAAVLRY